MRVKVELSAANAKIVDLEKALKTKIERLNKSNQCVLDLKAELQKTGKALKAEIRKYEQQQKDVIRENEKRELKLSNYPTNEQEAKQVDLLHTYTIYTIYIHIHIQYIVIRI